MDELSGPVPRLIEYQLSERIARLEWAHEELGKRLSQGAEAFSDLRDSIASVRKDLVSAHERFQEAIAPKPIPWWRIAGVIITVLVLAGGWVWQISKYPTRDEFDRYQRDAQGASKGIDAEIRALREKQAEISTEQRLVTESAKRGEESIRRIEDKLERLVK